MSKQHSTAQQQQQQKNTKMTYICTLWNSPLCAVHCVYVPGSMFMIFCLWISMHIRTFHGACVCTECVSAFNSVLLCYCYDVIYFWGFFSSIFLSIFCCSFLFVVSLFACLFVDMAQYLAVARLKLKNWCHQLYMARFRTLLSGA